MTNGKQHIVLEDTMSTGSGTGTLRRARGLPGDI